MNYDTVNYPLHYCSHPSGIEQITISQNMSFNVGNAFKYLFRCNDKGTALQDIRKAKWYIEREIERRSKLRFRWFSENDEFDARFDGDNNIAMVLAFECRYSGWMTGALERLFTASVYPRGIKALQNAYSRVENIERMERARLNEPV